jgi:DNA-binding NarL/FixJ family response regulator
MPQSEQRRAAHSRADSSVGSKKILVIDDGEAVRDMIRTFLEKEGFQVCGEAADGVQAIKQAKKLKPDLVILDMAMPRMNGVEAASVINRMMPSLPIVLHTVYEDSCLAGSFVSASGIRAVVSKTDGLDKLVACVQSLLQTGGQVTPR